MNQAAGWPANRMKKHRAITRKPKIRWEVLGLPHPPDAGMMTSMKVIRQQVSSMASCGIGQAARFSMIERDTKPISQRPVSNSKKQS